jgi:glycosyltransferase involved in cell wall biosynthesis
LLGYEGDWARPMPDLRPLVSVLMAVHNGARYLIDAVESILDQSLNAFEFVIVDDGSTDRSANILARLADRDSRILLRAQEQTGLAQALNHGLHAARGKYVARMDADDISYPDRLSAQVDRMESEPELVLLSASFDYIDSQGEVLKRKIVSTDSEILRRKLTEDRNQFCHPCAMMRREVVGKLGGYRTIVGSSAQDYDLWLRMAEVGGIANLAQPLLGYRVHEEQVSVSNIVAQRHAAEVYKALALQRRLTGYEDLSAAIEAVARKRKMVMRGVASDCIGWASLFSRMGSRHRAGRMVMKAVWSSPCSPQLWRTLGRLLRDSIGSRELK